MLWHTSETPNPGTMAWSAQTQEGKIYFFQQVRQPSIPSPMEEDTSKILDTIGTVFIQGPSILLLVRRSIMLNGSFLGVCRILRFVKKLDFAFLSLGGRSHGARVWCLSRVPKHRNQWQEVEGLLFNPHYFLCFGTQPRHQTRAPCLCPRRLMKGKSNFLHNP